MSSDTTLLPCPFCGFDPSGDSEDLLDILYPVAGWRYVDDGKAYVAPNALNLDGHTWGLHCTECMGGCGAQIEADSRDEVVAKWNRRAAIATATGGAA